MSAAVSQQREVLWGPCILHYKHLRAQRQIEEAGVIEKSCVQCKDQQQCVHYPAGRSFEVSDCNMTGMIGRQQVWWCWPLLRHAVAHTFFISVHIFPRSFACRCLTVVILGCFVFFFRWWVLLFIYGLRCHPRCSQWESWSVLLNLFLFQIRDLQWYS